MFRENINYYKTTKVPINILEKAKMVPQNIKKEYKLISGTRAFKIAVSLALAIVAISTSVYLASAYEAHVINVTAHICNYSETRTIGYWKNHPEIYDPALLPQFVGTDSSCSWYRNVDSQTVVDEVLDTSAPKGKNHEPKDMHIQLRAQLLAMKFNIAYFGIGGYSGTETGGITLDQLVAQADVLLCNPNATREELEVMKNSLDILNNLHQIRYCGAVQPIFSLFALPEVTIEENITTNEGVDIISPTSTEIFISEEEQTAASTEETTEATTTEEVNTAESTTTNEEIITEPETPEVPPTEENSTPLNEPTGESGESINTEPAPEIPAEEVIVLPPAETQPEAAPPEAAPPEAAPEGPAEPPTEPPAEI